jgi:SAM-dependent methyltransferase
MPADFSQWSKPTIVQVTESTAALPEPEEPEAQAEPEAQDEPEAPAEPEAQAEPETQAEPQTQLDPERVAQPDTAMVPARRRPASASSRAPVNRGPGSRGPLNGGPVNRGPRAAYPAGSRPSFADKLVEKVADVAVVAMPIPRRVLDVGCGGAQLLSELILRIPYAELYVGVDPRSNAVPDAVRDREPRLSVVQAAAEALPFPSGSFDLVIASLSLTLWMDQAAGAVELARVVSDNGRVVIIEGRKPQLSGRNRVHGAKELTRLLESAGLKVERVQTVLRSATKVSLAHAFIAAP